MQYPHNITTAVTQYKVNRGPLNVTAVDDTPVSVNPRTGASQTAVSVDPTDPELRVMWVTSDDDPSPSRASAPIRPCWCKLRMESAMMRAVFFWYPPDVTMSMGTPCRLAALNTISSLFIMPWKRERDGGGGVNPRPQIVPVMPRAANGSMCAPFLP